LRAFLSHSSFDKDFVERVAENLRPGTYELDSTTFDAGLVNSDAIQIALRRSDLFCLFLTEASARSTYVEFETLLGMEFLARGGISRFIAICLDDVAFKAASETVKFYNIVRKSLSPEAAARLIQGQLVSAKSKAEHFSHPFLGREEELKALDDQISDHKRPNIKSIYISGNIGTGRRAIASVLYTNQFPHVGKIFPQVRLSAYDGPEELYRNLLSELRPTMTSVELRARMTDFGLAKPDHRMRMAAQLLNSLLPSNEAAIILDEGGVLTDAGVFSPEISKLIDDLEAHPHPPVTFVSGRMIQHRHRVARPEIVFLAVGALTWNASRKLMSTLLKRQKIEVDTEQLEQLTQLSDTHPYNIYHIVDIVIAKGIKSFLANPSQFIDWKHRQSSEYFSKLNLEQNDSLVLALLRNIPELDFDTITLALSIDPKELAENLHKLVLLHVLESDSDRFRISPALRTAIERDSRVSMPSDLQSKVTAAIAQTLCLRIEEGTAPVSLVDSAVLASVESGDVLTEFATAFLLPSHYVWLSKLRYDRHQWTESIRFGLEALKGEARLSVNGMVAACRFLCLASARTGTDEVFDNAITKLRSRASDDWARSNIFYLDGFRERMRGKLPAAQELFQKACDSHSGNVSAMRELAAIALARGDLNKAEVLARRAQIYAPSNPYLVDMLLTVLIRKRTTKVITGEMDDLFNVLEKVGEEDGRSFYTTRKAEFEYLCGDIRLAASLIDQAVTKTPMIFEVRRLQAEIYIKIGNKNRAEQAIQAMTKMIEDRKIYDRRTNYRLFLETKASFLTEVGQFQEAKILFDDLAYFTREERDKAVKNIEVAQSFASKKRS
jgi:tetratricopeptide (TPR) repeat protein